MEYIGIAQAAFAASILYVSWLVLRSFIVKSPLDNLPGPPRASWISGAFILGSSFRRVEYALSHIHAQVT